MTDPTPNLSKTKCGEMGVVYPNPVKLGDHALPWVEHATHLGHELHQLCNMEYDAGIKRAQFIRTAVEISETFGFARPQEILQAVQTYTGHWYGSMLWDLYGDKSEQIFRSWSTNAKLVWKVPRSCHTYLVDNLLTAQFYTVKQQLRSRYVTFVRTLLSSISPEVCIVANMVARCARATTGNNLIRLERETGLAPWVEPAWKVREAVPRVEVPPTEGWRLQYLRKLLDARRELDIEGENIDEISNLIDSLCST